MGVMGIILEFHQNHQKQINVTILKDFYEKKIFPYLKGEKHKNGIFAGGIVTQIYNICNDHFVCDPINIDGPLYLYIWEVEWYVGLDYNLKRVSVDD